MSTWFDLSHRANDPLLFRCAKCHNIEAIDLIYDIGLDIARGASKARHAVLDRHLQR